MNKSFDLTGRAMNHFRAFENHKANDRRPNIWEIETWR